jgi:hypothetical protein
MGYNSIGLALKETKIEVSDRSKITLGLKLVPTWLCSIIMLVSILFGWLYLK